MLKTYIRIKFICLRLILGAVGFALIQSAGILYADSSSMIVDGSNHQTSLYSEQYKQRYQQLERNYGNYGLKEGGYYSAQNDARGNYINRMSGYFGSKGVSVYDPQNLNRALLYDQSERQKNLSNLNSSSDSTMRSIYTGYGQAIRSVVDSSGQLSTYDTGQIRSSAESLKNLAVEAEKFENYLSNDFRRQYKDLVLAPYLEKSDLIRYSDQVDGMVNRFIYGGTDYSGVSGLKSNLRDSSSSLMSVATQIKDQEDQMRNNLTQSYVLGGLGLALSLVAAIPTAGTSLFAAKLAIGAGIVGGTTSLGNSIRTNVVLNEKGIEGFRSSAESKAQMGIQSFQYLTTAVSIGSSLYNLGSSLGQAAVVTSNVGGSASNEVAASTVRATAWSGMSLSQRSYTVFQGLSGVNSLTDIGGFKENAIGENASQGLNAGFVLGNLIYSHTDIPSNVSKTIQIYGLHQKQGIPIEAAEKFVNRSISEPFLISRKGATLISNFNRGLNDVGSVISIVQEFPEGRSFLNENWLIPAGNRAFGLISNITEQYRDHSLNKRIEQGRFTKDDVSRYFNVKHLSVKDSESYLYDKDNTIYVKAAIETNLYDKQTTLNPYTIEKKSDSLTIKNLVSRNVDLSEIKGQNLDVQKLAISASLYKRNPELNSYQNSIISIDTNQKKDTDKAVKLDENASKKQAVEGDLMTNRYVINQNDFKILVDDRNINLDEILKKYKPIETNSIFKQQSVPGEISIIQHHKDWITNTAQIQIMSSKIILDKQLNEIANNLKQPTLNPIPRIELNRVKTK